MQTLQRPPARDFRKRVIARDHVLGTFVKTPTSHATEILGQIGFDFVIIDQEHSPFDRMAVDVACLAGRAANIAVIVRVPEANASMILAALDCGANGVMVPHCDSPAKAREIASASTTRAGGFGAASYEGHKEEQDANVACIAMIEDPAALPHLDAIAATPGLDAFFIGRGDLTAAMGPEGMKAAVLRITAAARVASIPAMALVSSRDDAKAMRELGVTAFAFSSDHGLMKAAAAQARKDFGDHQSW
jgi:staphyloferrin B biosynthesis citrate synthase